MISSIDASDAGGACQAATSERPWPASVVILPLDSRITPKQPTERRSEGKPAVLIAKVGFPTSSAPIMLSQWAELRGSGTAGAHLLSLNVETPVWAQSLAVAPVRRRSQDNTE